MNFPPSPVTPVTVTPIIVTTISNTPSSCVTDPVLSSPTSSSDPPDSFEDNSVVQSTQPLLVLAQKTLESVGSEIDFPFDTRRTIFDFSLMTKVLVTYDPIFYAQAKDKP